MTHLPPFAANPSASKKTHPVSGRAPTTKAWRTIPLKGYLLAIVVLAGITPLLIVLKVLIGYRSVGLLYLVTTVITALFLERGPTIFAALFSLMLWDYYFLVPIPAFGISDLDDMLLAGTYLVVALVLGHLTNRTREQERARREGEKISTSLYLLTKEIARVSNFSQLLETVTEQTRSIMKVPAGILLLDPSGALQPPVGSITGGDIPPEAMLLAGWCAENKRAAGRFTSHHPGSRFLFLPLLRSDKSFGVLALDLGSLAGLSKARREMLDGFASQISLAFEHQRLREESEKNRLLAESEKLGKSLLDSMSHEIRTPLAAIQAAAGSLLEEADSSLKPSQVQLLGEIREAAERLNRLAGKVMDITRVESGLTPRFAPCDIADLIQVSIKEVRQELSRHSIHTRIEPGLPLMMIDFVLMQQALTNLLGNAGRHTPPGTHVFVSAGIEGGEMLITVADSGPGIPPESLPRLFDKFYRCPGAPTGGTGLGLSLVKGFVEAHRGKASVSNRPGGGTIFTLALPNDNQIVVEMD